MSYEEREIWRINTENAVSEVCRTYGADVAGSVFQRYEPPWLTTRGNLPVTAPSDRTIDKEFIGNYFFKKFSSSFGKPSPGKQKAGYLFRYPACMCR